jgi:FkbM family methyltransferase
VTKAQFHARNAVKFALNYRGERRAIRRGYQFALLRKLTPFAAVQQDGITYFLDTRDDVLSRMTYEQESFDLQFMDSALALLKERCGDVVTGRTFVDVGANIGTSCLPALLRYGARRVIAFEPLPSNLHLLRVNLLANDVLDRVDIRPLVASNREGAVTLELSPDNCGDNRVRMNDIDGKHGEMAWDTVRVPAVTLEQSLANVDDIGLVWVDVQGHEGHVLEGMGDLLGRVPVVIEYWPYHLERSGGLSLLNQLVTAAYPTVIDIRASGRGHGVVSFPGDRIEDFAARLDPSSGTDYLLIPEDFR